MQACFHVWVRLTVRSCVLRLVASLLSRVRSVVQTCVGVTNNLGLHFPHCVYHRLNGIYSLRQLFCGEIHILLPTVDLHHLYRIFDQLGKICHQITFSRWCLSDAVSSMITWTKPKLTQYSHLHHTYIHVLHFQLKGYLHDIMDYAWH